MCVGCVSAQSQQETNQQAYRLCDSVLPSMHAAARPAHSQSMAFAILCASCPIASTINLPRTTAPALIRLGSVTFYDTSVYEIL